MAILNDISFYRGEATSLVFTMTPVVNITGWTIMFTVKVSQIDTVAVITQQATIPSPETGQFVVPLTHSQTNIRPTTYYYDVQRTDSNNEAVLSIGILNVTQEVLY